MRNSSLRFIFLIALATPFLMGGCRNSGNSFDMSAHATKWAAAKSAAREELVEIPPPVKNDYVGIDQEQQWQNPYLSVEQRVIQIRFYYRDENSSEVDRGGLTRLQSARRQVVNVRLADLPRALSSLPDGAWPYGRVVAIGRDKLTAENRAWFPKNVAIAVRALKDMGIVVDDWNSPTIMQ
ncbi:MAG: hypothetical protein ACRD28_03815 [Acidobacteriaceae bacterium]